MIHPKTHPGFVAMYPLGSKLGLKVIDAGPGFDTLDLQKELGNVRYAALMASVKQVFCCQHAAYPKDHPNAGYEVHCVYAKDLESFLKAGG